MTYISQSLHFPFEAFMKSASKTCFVALAALLFAAFSFNTAAAADLTRVFYPNEAEMAFTVDVTSDWELTPQEDEDGYFEVAGPNDLELSFRVVPGADIDAAVKDHVDYLKENFTDIKVADAKPVTINGLEAILLPGSGVDEDESARELGAGWFKLPGGQIGELWYNVEDSDAAGKTAASAVLNSLKGK